MRCRDRSGGWLLVNHARPFRPAGKVSNRIDHGSSLGTEREHRN
jgi:hypothetical protein